jgi:hypothetical protein
MLTHVKASGHLRAQFHYDIRLWRLWKWMMNLGYNSYEDVQKHGIVDLCGICPQPGKNLPEGWENDPLA